MALVGGAESALEDSVLGALHAALASATDVADLQQLLPQLQAAEASVSAALQDMAEGREGSAPLAPAASAAPSPCQEQAKAHGKRVIIPALQVSEDLLPPTQQRAAALRGQARGLAKLLPGLHASQRLARELRESIGQVQEESQPVVHRIKQLHKQQVAAEDTLERVQDLADLRAGLAELEAAMRQGQTQSAAVSIKQLRALQQRLPMHSSDLQTIAGAEAQVLETVQRQFDDAVAAGRAGEVKRLYQLMSMLGGSSRCMAAYAQYTCATVTRDMLEAVCAADDAAVQVTVQHCMATMAAAVGQEGQPSAPAAPEVETALRTALHHSVQAGIAAESQDATAVWIEPVSGQVQFVNAVALVFSHAVRHLHAALDLAKADLEVSGDPAYARRLLAAQPHGRWDPSAVLVPPDVDPSTPALQIMLAVHLPAQLVVAAILRMLLSGRGAVGVYTARLLEMGTPLGAIAPQVTQLLGPPHPSTDALRQEVQAAGQASTGAAAWSGVLRGTPHTPSGRTEDSVEAVLDEMALVLQKCTSYFRTLSQEAHAADQAAEAAVSSVVASSGLPSATLRRSASAARQARQAGDLLGACGEVAVVFTVVQGGVISRGVSKASFLEHIVEFPPIFSTLMDDCFYVLQRVGARVVATGNADAVCAFLHAVTAQLTRGEEEATPAMLMYPSVRAASLGDAEGGSAAASDTWGSTAATLLGEPEAVPDHSIGAVLRGKLQQDITAASKPPGAPLDQVLPLVTSLAVKREVRQAVAGDGPAAAAASSAVKLHMRSPGMRSPGTPRASGRGGSSAATPRAPTTPKRGGTAGPPGVVFATPTRGGGGGGAGGAAEGLTGSHPAVAIAAAAGLNTLQQALELCDSFVRDLAAELGSVFMDVAQPAAASAPPDAVAEGQKVAAALSELQEAQGEVRALRDVGVTRLFKGLSPRLRGAMTVMEGKHAILRYDGQAPSTIPAGYDVFGAEFLGVLDGILAPYVELLAPAVAALLLTRAAKYTCRLASSHLRKKAFTLQGALALDRHVRALGSFFEERGVWTAGELVEGVEAQAAMLLADTPAAAVDVWQRRLRSALRQGGSSASHAGWVEEGLAFPRAILALRVEWGAEAVEEALQGATVPVA